MAIDPPGLLAIAAVIALALPPLDAPASAGTIEVRLCGGGVVHLAPGGGRVPGDAPGGCHAACALRRDDDDRGRRPGTP